MRSLQEITSDALLLSPKQRLSLASQLLASVDGEDADAEAAWEKEIQERLARWERGEVKGIPIEEVFRNVDQKLGKLRSS